MYRRIIFSTALAVALGGAVSWLFDIGPWFISKPYLGAIVLVSVYITWAVWVEEFSSKERSSAPLTAIAKRRIRILFVMSATFLAVDAFAPIGAGLQAFFMAVCIISGSMLMMKRPLKDASIDKGDRSAALTVIFFTLLAVILVAKALALKTIDSDEARLIFDARSIAEGLVPFRDFGARSPLLIYILAPLYRWLGNAFWAYHAFAAAAVWATCLSLYTLVKRFAGRYRALAIVAAYAAMPVALNFLFVKTQTFEMLFVVLSLISFVHASQDSAKRSGWRWVSHALMLCALLIRPSAAIFYAFHLAIARANSEPKSARKESFRIFAEAIAVGTVFVGLTLVLFKAAHGIYTSPFRWSFDDVSFLRFALTPSYIPLAVLGISIAAVLSTLLGKVKNSPLVVGAALSIGALSVGYALNAVLIGFWPQYYMEFVLPATILAVYGIGSAARSIEQAKKRSLFIAIATFACAASLLPAYSFLNGYLGAFSTREVSAAASAISVRTAPGDVIFAGNPIFAVASGRKQFLDLSHSYYDEASVAAVTRAIKATQDLPRVIIEDSYFDRYFMNDSGFRIVFDACYAFDSRQSGFDDEKMWSFGIYRLSSGSGCPR